MPTQGPPKSPPRGAQGKPRASSPPAQRPRQRPETAPEDPAQPTFFDLHLRIGIDDLWVRLAAMDWQRLVDAWMLAGEDVILRAVYKARETDIVLRGSGAHVYLSVQPASPENSKKIGTFNLVRVSDLRLQRLEEMGIRGSGGTGGR